MNKVVLVTGSSKGVGASTIKEFSSHGYDVVINYLNSEEKADKLKKFVETNYKVKALCIKCDVSNESEVRNMIDRIVKDFGYIDVLVNNAGTAMDLDIFDKTKEEFMRVIEVNTFGTFLVSREVIKNSNVKTIINISSTDSIDTYNELSSDYCVSKVGVNVLTKIFAMKFKGIKVIALAPNWIDTESIMEMYPQYLESELKRIGQKKLLTKLEVSKKIYSLVDNKNIKSGDIIRMDGVSNA